MKKMIIGTIVGALILFIWQFLAWSILPLHEVEQQYTENSEAILQVLSENLTPGEYMVPRTPPDATAEEVKSFLESVQGKPWAMISYRESFSTAMAGNMIRGFAADLFAVFLLCWVLLHYREISMKTVLTTTVAIGLIGYLFLSYLQGIWYEYPTLPDLIDTLVQWGLVGLWLGYYLPRG